MIPDDVIARTAKAVEDAGNGIDGDSIGVTLTNSDITDTSDESERRATASTIAVQAAKACISAIMPGDRLAGDLVARVDDGSTDPGRARCWNVDARVTGYERGVLPSTRIDEIVLNGPMHLEMMDEKSAYLGVGENQFNIFIRNGELFVTAMDRTFDDKDGWEDLPA